MRSLRASITILTLSGALLVTTVVVPPNAIATTVTSRAPSLHVATTSHVSTHLVDDVGPMARVGSFHFGTLWIWISRGTRRLRTLIIFPREQQNLSLPVLVFAHGWDNNPVGYLPVLEGWASAGLVVVAPTAPGMAKGLPLVNENLANLEQLADLPVVLTNVLRWHLPIHLDPGEVAYAGHSDGGDAVAAMALNPAYSDPRSRAYFLLAAGADRLDSTHPFSNRAPVYVADSFCDEYGNWPSALRLYSISNRPKALVAIGRNETHLSPWVHRSSFNVALWQSTVDFYAWALTRTPVGRLRIVRDLSVSGFGEHVA